VTPTQAREQRVAELRARKVYWQEKLKQGASDVETSERMVKCTDKLLGQAERALEEQHERDARKTIVNLVPEFPERSCGVNQTAVETNLAKTYRRAFEVLYSALQKIRVERDYQAEHGAPLDRRLGIQFDDWAADLAEQAMIDASS
jgi:hypothetical protein